MNSALRNSVATAWLMVTLTVSLSHADQMKFSADIKPVLASVIDQLPVESVNKITPHMEDLARIVKGTAMYEFFQNIVEECHKYQAKVNAKNGEESKAAAELPETVSQNENEEKSEKEHENVLDKENEVSEPEPSKEPNNDQTEPETNQSEDEEPQAAKTTSNSGKSSIPPKIKGLKEGQTYKLKTKKNVEISLTKKGDKVVTFTKKGDQKEIKKEFNFKNIENQQTKNFVANLLPGKN